MIFTASIIFWSWKLLFHILWPKNRQLQPVPKRVGQILEPEYSCALTENPAIWQWPDPLGIRRVGRPLKVIWDPPPAYLQALQQRLIGQRGSGWAFPLVPHCPTLLIEQCSIAHVMTMPIAQYPTRPRVLFTSMSLSEPHRRARALWKECCTMVQALKPPFGVDRLHELELLGFQHCCPTFTDDKAKITDHLW